MPVCPHCGQEVSAEARSCASCGQELPLPAMEPTAVVPPSPAPEPELKPVEYLKRGWELFKQYPGGFVGFTLLSIVIIVVMRRVPYLGALATIVIQTPLMAGYLVVAARLLQGRPVQFGDFFIGFSSQYLTPLALLSVVSSILILVGFILLVVPGIYLSVSYMFAAFFVLDQHLDFWPAMEASRQAVGPRWFSFFGFSLLLLLVILAGALLLGVGVLVAMPVCYCAVTAAYADVFGFKSSF